MQFDESDTHSQIADAIDSLCSAYGDDYWAARDQDRRFPHEFHADLAGAGWLGIAMPQEFGGSGLGIGEAAVMMERIAATGAGMSGASAVHMNIFGLHPVVVHGSEEQKRRWLPPLIAGQDRACFAVTEPNSGLNTLGLKTRATLMDGYYLLTGQKVWISTAQVANKIMILARTSPVMEDRPGEGLTLFYADLNRAAISVHEIEKMGRACVDSNELFIEALEIPVADRIGAEGQGFKYILDGLNPERILIASEAVGLGRAALRRASDYARSRVVFDRPIGANQGIQHPLARCWMELEAASLMVKKAAHLYDSGRPCAAEANAAKFLAAEACYRTCEQAIFTHGGMGYAKEYHVERYLREAWIPRIAPISPHLILCFIAEKVLGLPKSY
jgi:acyl-CoA dehydrogenase